jgi:hypothetical protein
VAVLLRARRDLTGQSQYSVTLANIAQGLMSALYAKCASCRHSSGCEVGSLFCRVWGTVLSASWSLIDLCPHWSPLDADVSGGGQLRADALTIRRG